MAFERGMPGTQVKSIPPFIAAKTRRETRHVLVFPLVVIGVSIRIVTRWGVLIIRRWLLLILLILLR